MAVLLRIVAGEQAFSPTVLHWVEKNMWQEGVPGVTIRRGEMSLDGQGHFHAPVLEDAQFNDLPLILESILPAEEGQRLALKLSKNLPHGQISIIKGLEEKVEDTAYDVIKIFTKERNAWFKETEKEAVLRFLKNQGVIWATITKGVAGYGQDRIVHKQKLFSTSKQLPLVIECVVPADARDHLLAMLKEKVTEGIIFTKSVEVVKND